MTLLIQPTPLVLWHDTIKTAENRCSITLTEELEVYLISLLMRYANKPEIAHHVFAKTFLESQQSQERRRQEQLQHLGDECLLFAGLFPDAAERKHVNLNYFVDLGRGAYSMLSQITRDLYWLLASHFVSLMDVLQSINPSVELKPIKAYDQWEQLGSRRAYLVLRERGIPVRTLDKHR